MELLLDLVAAVEAGQHLSVANVLPRKNTLEGLTAPRALRLQAKQQQLQARTRRAPAAQPARPACSAGHARRAGHTVQQPAAAVVPGCPVSVSPPGRSKQDAPGVRAPMWPPSGGQHGVGHLPAHLARLNAPPGSRLAGPATSSAKHAAVRR